MDRTAPISFARHNAAWNERDTAKVRSHLDRSVTPDVVFADPANRTVGIDALESLIVSARNEFPDAEYTLASDIDGGHDRRYRYHWTARLSAETAFPGFDVTTVDDGGRITRIDGFFGELHRTP